MRPFKSLLATTLLLLIASCGGSTPADSVNAGFTSLNEGSHSEALGSFNAALAGMETSDPKFTEAKVGQIRAQSYIDPAKAKADLLGLDKASGVTAKDYNQIVTDFVASATAGASKDEKAAQNTIGYAVEILTSGKQSFPEYTKWDGLIKRAGDTAKSLGAAGALDSLKGLGYVGGD